jgi:hypothetical protein
VKLQIDTSDPEIKAVWETALQARAEVASWPAWKRETVKDFKVNDRVKVINYPTNTNDFVDKTGTIIRHSGMYYVVHFDKPVGSYNNALFAASELEMETSVIGISNFIPGPASPLSVKDIYGTPCHVGDMVIFTSTGHRHNTFLLKGAIKAFSPTGRATIEGTMPNSLTSTFCLQNNRFIKL